MSDEIDKIVGVEIDSVQVERLTCLIFDELDKFDTDVKNENDRVTFQYGLKDARTWRSVAIILGGITNVLVRLDNEKEFNEAEKLEVINNVIMVYAKPSLGFIVKIPFIGNFVLNFAKKKIRILSGILVKYLDVLLWDERFVEVK